MHRVMTQFRTKAERQKTPLQNKNQSLILARKTTQQTFFGGKKKKIRNVLSFTFINVICRNSQQKIKCFYFLQALQDALPFLARAGTWAPSPPLAQHSSSLLGHRDVQIPTDCRYGDGISKILNFSCCLNIFMYNQRDGSLGRVRGKAESGQDSRALSYSPALAEQHKGK